MRPVTVVLALLFLALAAVPAGAQLDVPATGLQAEGMGRWEDALSLYRSALQKDPARQELWLRVSDIQARLGESAEAAESLRQATLLSPNDDGLYAKLARAYASAGKPAEAEAAIEKALALKPGNLEYLKIQGQLAAWNGKYGIARRAYETTLRASPDDQEASLGLARVYCWSGRVEESIRLFKPYVAKNPRDRDARLDYAKALTWRGDFAQALDVLEGYRHDFGETDQYLDQKALVLAMAGRASDSLAISSARLASEPSNYGAAYAKSIALANGRQPDEAVASLDTLAQLGPTDPLTEGARLFVTTPLKSFVRPGTVISHDSDGIDITTFLLDAQFAVNPGTRILAGAWTSDLYAPLNSGYAPTSGGDSVRASQGFVGASHRFSSSAALEGWVGGAKVQNGDSTFAYHLKADFNPSDELQVSVQTTYGFYLISPLSASLGIKRSENQILVRADPTLSFHLDAVAGYDAFSDSNRRWDAVLAPRWAVLRTQAFNLDLGLSGTWYGFKDDPGHGYYSPNHYQRYAATAFGYWKIDDNDGIGLSASAGMLKDNFMDHFEFGYDAAAEGHFGIYRTLYLVARVAYSHNNRTASGAYSGTTGSLFLSWRF